MVDWVGFVASGSAITVVRAQVPDNADEPLIVTYDHTWPLQGGDRPAAYNVLYQQVANYLRENRIDVAIVKGSAVLAGGSMKKAHLEGAEVRGVVIAAAAATCAVRVLAKAAISRNFGDRKVDEYVKDDSFWAQRTTGGKLRVGSREAAMLLIAAR